MTTKQRLYFTDPIVAFYMMREFGVKFEIKTTDSDKEVWELFGKDAKEFFPFENLILSNSSNVGELEFGIEKIYVCKDWEAFFEVSIDDLVSNTTKGVPMPHQVSGKVHQISQGEDPLLYLIVPERHNGKRHFCIYRSAIEIIMRDNKQFFQALKEGE